MLVRHCAAHSFEGRGRKQVVNARLLLVVLLLVSSKWGSHSPRTCDEALVRGGLLRRAAAAQQARQQQACRPAVPKHPFVWAED
jgi:hypothetical protein